ncbi:MAG: helix-turn-helix domain-containing protein [Planctomycetia bacterium]|nr:helix-turn-helix domain-containing protein [Planctomycetia bacterium]
MLNATTRLSPSDVGELIGCGRQAVVAWIQRGILPAVRTPTGRYLIDLADVERILRPALAPAPVLQLLPRPGGVRA